MKIIKIGEPRVIIEAQDEQHNNFAFPSIARLQDGRIAVVASGFRRRLMCPFGKVVISYSDNEGQTYTPPAVVLDTPLDNPCAGITTFGERGVIISSFSHSVASSKSWAKGAIELDYLDSVSSEEEKRYLGGNFIISQDLGESSLSRRSPLRTAPSSFRTALCSGWAGDTTALRERM